MTSSQRCFHRLRQRVKGVWKTRVRASVILSRRYNVHVGLFSSDDIFIIFWNIDTRARRHCFHFSRLYLKRYNYTPKEINFNESPDHVRINHRLTAVCANDTFSISIPLRQELFHSAVLIAHSHIFSGSTLSVCSRVHSIHWL